MEIIKDDEFGPELVVKVHDAKIGLDGFLVIDNTVLGPAKGGIRMNFNVSEEEVRRLARAMTWKNAIAGIPFGGGKSGIIWKGGTPEQKKAVMQGFARAIKVFTPKKYIAGPDVNTGELEMAQFVEATGIFNSATGKPANLCLPRPLRRIEASVKAGMKHAKRKGEKCGLPHEFGSTGFGVACSAKTAVEVLGIDIKGATVSIHGFGNVGTFAYTFLTEMGAKIIAIADKDGAVYSANGFDANIMKDIIKNRKPISDYKQGKIILSEDFWKIPVDILIPASVTDVINDNNKNNIKAKLIVEAGNIPMRENVEDELFKKGIYFVPDFVANAGGVISSYAEHKGYSPKKMFEIVESKIIKATKDVMKESLAKKINPRVVAMDLAKKIILAKKQKKK
jgi:glutamate dehydrogenase/leucine dehydrogenase